MERRNSTQTLSLLFALVLLTSCVTPTENTGSTEMTGEPVNIVLKGQKEMCEREPDSILCKDDTDE